MIKRSIIVFWAMISAVHFSTASAHVIPFRTYRNLIVFQGTVQGRSGNFILDTGVLDLVLNQSCFEENANTVSGRQFESIHGAAQSYRGDHLPLHLDGLPIRCYAVLIDLRSIEQSKGFSILGLVGMRCFQQYELTIDFFSQQIILYDLDGKGDRILADPLPLPTETLTFRYKQHLPYVNVRVGQSALKLGFDTGMEANVLSTKLLANLREQIGDIQNKAVIGVNGQTSLAPSAWLENVQVGKRILPPMETIFLSLVTLNRSPGPDLDGLLGLAFLKRFRAAFNFKKKELYLWDKEATRQGALASGTY